VGGSGGPVIPSLKAEGSLRPATRWNPRSPVSDPLCWLRLWCLNNAGTAPAKGMRPARSAMPAPRDDPPPLEPVTGPAALAGNAR
jgi:hypothetical protein